MAEARGRHDWAQTSALLALLANVNRDPRKKRRAFKPADFDPYAIRDRRARGIPLAKLGLLREAFVKH